MVELKNLTPEQLKALSALSPAEIAKLGSESPSIHNRDYQKPEDFETEEAILTGETQINQNNLKDSEALVKKLVDIPKDYVPRTVKEELTDEQKKEVLSKIIGGDIKAGDWQDLNKTVTGV